MKTKKLPLGKGLFAIVDDDTDFYWLNQWRWQCAKINNKLYVFRSRRHNHLGYSNRAYLHRIIMRIEDTRLVVDHIDGNPLNNVKSNLRIVTTTENNRNTSSHKNSTSEYLGVSWDKTKSKWLVRIQGIYVGRFSNEVDAAKAYDKKAKEIFGRFANLNFK
jgi:hypothetical protein